MVISFLLLLAGLAGWFLPGALVQAHEAYVLPYETFWRALGEPAGPKAFDALKNPHNFWVFIVIAATTALLLTLNLLLRRTKLGGRLHRWPERYAHLGRHFVRFAIAAAFFFSAASQTFLGPELREGLFPHAPLISLAVFAISLMIAFGLFTEAAALLGLAVFIKSFSIFGPYLLTYFNYLGELIVLLLFGLRTFSLDHYLFGPLRRFKYLKKYETTIIRAFYGLGLMYAAVTVKLLHPAITLQVVTDWHLTRFHWLFPADPLLVTFGAGLAELVIGFFITIGFELRLTVLVSLFYLTLSLLYFGEAVWPHLLLYGLSFNLLVQPETFTLDNFLFQKPKRPKGAV